MTVHGAKGLEAPIVFLADTTTRPEGHHPPPLLSLPAQTGAAPLIWAKGEKEDVGPMNDARLAARVETRHEYRRLLYVAMTRAAEQVDRMRNRSEKTAGWLLVRSRAARLAGPTGFQRTRGRRRDVVALSQGAPTIRERRRTPPVSPGHLSQSPRGSRQSTRRRKARVSVLTPSSADGHTRSAASDLRP